MQRIQLSWAIIALSACLAGCSGSNSKAAQAGGPGARSIAVKVTTAKLQPVGVYTEYLGTLVSRNSAVLQPDVDGQITKIYVHSGQQVAAGATILEINPQKQQATVQSTEANQSARDAALALAKQDLQRTQQL